MKIQKRTLQTLVVASTFILFSCGKDDSPNTPDPQDDDPTPPVEVFYDVTEAAIDDSGYTALNELILEFSVDDGNSYSEELPTDLEEGDEINVKINNGTKDIGTDDFTFDWSTSSPQPLDPTAAEVKFVVGKNDLAISVAVLDKMTFVVSERTSGQFYSLDPTSEVVALAPAFAIMQVGDTLKRVRSMTYNSIGGKLYVSNTPSGPDKAKLHSVDPNTMEATIVNGNEEDTWKSIADLILAENGKIFATISSGQGVDPSLIEFGLDGAASEAQLFTGESIPCCGLGLTLGSSAGEYLIGDGSQNPVFIHKSNSSGVISESIELSLKGFPEDNYYIKNLTKDNAGNIFSICYGHTAEDTFLAKVDLDAGELIHIAKIGTGGVDQYNAMAYIPAYLF